MNKILISGGLLLATLLITSCDNREDYFESVNQIPQLTIQQGDSVLNTIYEDTIKVGFPITFKYSFTDEEKMSLKTFKSSFNDNLEIIDNTISIICGSIGTSKFSLFVEDSFHKRKELQIVFNVFENQAPVSVFNLAQIDGSNEIVINANESFDKDSKFDGKVVLYEYKIASNYTAITTEPKINYVCGTKGLKKIIVRVQDNSGAWSAETTKFITLN